MDASIFSTSFALIALLAFLLAMPFDKRIFVGFALLAAFYLAVDDFATGLPTIVKGLAVFNGQWNWTGKVISLAFAAMVMAVFGLSTATVGLTFKQRHLTTGLVALALFVVWGACLGLLFKPGVPNGETLAFQAMMPGLAEELAYRGIAPALLLGLKRRKGAIKDIPWAVILSTSVVFGVWHGLNYSHGKFSFDVMSALFPFLGNIPGGWLRFRTGSLVFPILAHGIANVAFHVAGGLAT